MRLAAVALQVGRAVVPDYRAPRSRHVYTQPQLLAVLCLMRYHDWTFRDAEVRLAEHAELRAALGLARAPDHTTLWRFLARVPLAALQAMLEDMLAEVLRRSRRRRASAAGAGARSSRSTSRGWPPAA